MAEQNVGWALVDQGAVPTVIVAGVERLAAFRRDRPERDGGLCGFEFKKIQQPKEVFTLWTDQMRTNLGLKSLMADDVLPDPNQYKVTGYTYQVRANDVLEVPTTVALSQPELDAALVAAKDQKKSLVDEKLRVTLEAGFEFNGHTFQVGEQDMIRVTGGGLVASLTVITETLKAGNPAWPVVLPEWPANFKWIDVDNVRVPMDAATAMAFGLTAFQVVATKIFHGRDLKDAIRDAVNMAALNAIDINSGW